MGQIMQILPPMVPSDKIEANHGENDRSQYFINIHPLANLKTYMPPLRL